MSDQRLQGWNKQKPSFTYAKDREFGPGLRDGALYADLGLAKGTGGNFHAHIITAIFCFAGLVRVVGRRSDGVERPARVGEAGSVAGGVGERSETRFGLKWDAQGAVRTHRSHRGYRRAKIRGGNQGGAGSRRWRTACSGHRA